MRRRTSIKAGSFYLPQEAHGGGGEEEREREREEELVQFGDGEWVSTSTVVNGEKRTEENGEEEEEGLVFGFVGDEGSGGKRVTVREVSRLWRYMGGRTPE